MDLVIFTAEPGDVVFNEAPIFVGNHGERRAHSVWDGFVMDQLIELPTFPEPADSTAQVFPADVITWD